MMDPAPEMDPSPDLLVVNAREIVTAAGPPRPRVGRELGDLARVARGALAAKDGRVVEVGPEDVVRARHPAGGQTRIVDAGGGVVLPGLVDCHSHLVFAGSRENEFLLKLQGVSYLDIQRAGGGIAATVAATRRAGSDELTALAEARLGRMLREGTTTVEAKSGYGLCREHEIRLLEVADGLARRRRPGPDGPSPGPDGPSPGPRIVSTLMGAHVVPAEYAGDRDGYVRLLNEQLTPEVARRGLAVFCDVFCEEGAFSVAESRAILTAGRRWGLTPKIHADELSASGGALLAAELGAISADHLLFVGEDGARALAAAGVVAVLLPGTSASLLLDRHAPARLLIERGVPVALATDFNPGSSPVDSMATVMALACRLLKLTPAEAIMAATVNAAWAIGLGREVGSLEPGKAADLVIFDAPTAEYIPYHLGASLVRDVFIGGKPAFSRERGSGLGQPGEA
jgi:imidazolonepropionase